MTTIVRTPYLAVTVNGTPLANVLSARVQTGYEQRVASAEVECIAPPASLQPWDVVEITMGGTQATAEVRFNGFFVKGEQDLFDHTHRLVCGGKLIRAEQHHNETNIDMTSFAYALYILHEDPPTSYGHTDEVMVATVLAMCGLIETADPPPATIEGTGRILGKPYMEYGFTWDIEQSGLAFIEELEEITLGYRTFDSMTGDVERRLIRQLPASTPDFTFTEGVDIERASVSDTILEAINRVTVNGWNGDKTERTYTASAPNPEITGPDPYPQYTTKVLSSSMIKYAGIVTDGYGIGAQEVASWLLEELNHRFERVQLTTPRDDLVSPADTILVNAPVRLGIDGRKYWVQGVEATCSKSAGFSQTFSCVGTVSGNAITEAVTAFATAEAPVPTTTAT